MFRQRNILQRMGTELQMTSLFDFHWHNTQSFRTNSSDALDVQQVKVHLTYLANIHALAVQVFLVDTQQPLMGCPSTAQPELGQDWDGPAGKEGEQEELSLRGDPALYPRMGQLDPPRATVIPSSCLEIPCPGSLPIS